MTRKKQNQDRLNLSPQEEKLLASDMDMGGPSSGGFVWFRVDGDKRAELSIPRFSLDEINIMVLSLLGRRARA